DGRQPDQALRVAHDDHAGAPPRPASRRRAERARLQRGRHRGAGERRRDLMIRRFSTLYVGHIEPEACGHAGRPADDRGAANARLSETFDHAIALAELTDALGYETLWLAEHHFQHEGYECIPNIPLLAVDLAHRTKRVKIGCAFNIVPTWHPLRLAED